MIQKDEATLVKSLPSDLTGHLSTAWWGMVLLIVTEATLFAYLVATYFNLRYNNDVWPIGGLPKPELLRPGINTIILLSSSLPMHWADSGIRHGDQRRLKLGLALSFIMGSIFLAIQIWGATGWKFTLATNAYSSIFITITAFHGIHVLIGLILSAVTQLLAWLGYFSARRHLAVQTTALYWHFVDIVWIFVFGTLHVSPYIL